MKRRHAAVLIKLGLLGLAFFLFVELLAHASWLLTRKPTKEQLHRVDHANEWPPKPKAIHRVTHWPKDKPRHFCQSPQMARRVNNGTLPPVKHRLPKEPLVIIPPHQHGAHLYGGNWQRLVRHEGDVSAVMGGRIGFDGLVRWDPMGQHVLPNLARQWQIHDEGRRITIWLRRGIKWSDGYPYTVDAIEFWLQDVLRYKKLTDPNAIDPVYRPGGELLKFKRHNDFKFSLQFKEPNSLIVFNAASQQGPDLMGLPAHYLKQFHPKYVPADQIQQMVAASQFSSWPAFFDDKRSWRNPERPRLSAWMIRERPRSGQNIVFVRNPYYWKVDPDGNQLPYIDTVALDLLDPGMVNLKVISGEATLEYRSINFDNLPMLMRNRTAGPADKNYRVLHWISGWANKMAITLNLMHPDPVMRRLFNTRDFRIAFSLAINRQEMNDVLYFGLGQPHQVAPLPTCDYYVQEQATAYTEYNPNEANHRLDAIGLSARDREGMRLRPDGKPLAIDIDITDTRGSIPSVELLKGHLSDVGLRIRVNNVARELAWLRRESGQFDVALGSGSQGGQAPLANPDDYVPVSNRSLFRPWARHYMTRGVEGIEPPPSIRKAQSLWRQVTQSTDPQKQKSLFAQITQINAEHLWRIGTLCGVPQLVIVNRRMVNVPEVAVESWIFRTLANVAPECFAIRQSDATAPMPRQELP